MSADGASAEAGHTKADDTSGADVEGADVEGADVKGADVKGADVEGADVKGADVKGADVEGADRNDAGPDGVGTDGVGTRGEDVDEIEVRDAISAPDADGVPRRTTRRFPKFTRDTARPEGAGRAAPGDALAARQWPIIAVLGVVALGLLLTALDLFRVGTLLIGVGLLAGAVLRWLLPGVGMLAVRSRFTDIVTYGVLGTAIVLLALMAQPSPWLQIPFLKDTLHFTVSG